MATINGTAAANNLVGTSGNDVINGLGGNDTINGGAGNDFIVGGAGQDFMTGGAGADTFLFQNGDISNDHVTDFGFGDVIDFSQIDPNSSLAGDQAFTIVSGQFGGPVLAGNIYFNALPFNQGTDVQVNINGVVQHLFLDGVYDAPFNPLYTHFIL